jgi:hypothetical protein
VARFAFTDFWDRGSLMMLGFLAHVGSLVFSGSLFVRGSLIDFGFLSKSGSLCTYGLLFLHGSLLLAWVSSK